MSFCSCFFHKSYREQALRVPADKKSGYIRGAGIFGSMERPSRLCKFYLFALLPAGRNRLCLQLIALGFDERTWIRYNKKGKPRGRSGRPAAAGVKLKKKR